MTRVKCKSIQISNDGVLDHSCHPIRRKRQNAAGQGTEGADDLHQPCMILQIGCKRAVGKIKRPSCNFQILLLL